MHTQNKIIRFKDLTIIKLGFSVVALILITSLISCNSLEKLGMQDSTIGDQGDPSGIELTVINEAQGDNTEPKQLQFKIINRSTRKITETEIKQLQVGIPEKTTVEYDPHSGTSVTPITIDPATAGTATFNLRLLYNGKEVDKKITIVKQK